MGGFGTPRAWKEKEQISWPPGGWHAWAGGSTRLGGIAHWGEGEDTASFWSEGEGTASLWGEGEGTASLWGEGKGTVSHWGEGESTASLLRGLG